MNECLKKRMENAKSKAIAYRLAKTSGGAHPLKGTDRSNETIERASIAVVVVTILAGMLAGGCMCYGPITVNVLSSRMVIASGSNTVRQAVDGGAATSPQLGLGDSAMEKMAKGAAEGATGAKPQNADGALDALKELRQ